MKKDSKIYIAGHNGLVGSAVLRRLKKEGYTNLVFKSSKELDLTRQAEVEKFFDDEKPEYVVLAAAKVGGILANLSYPAEFIYKNLMISTNIIHAGFLHKVKKLINLGSSCIYPRNTLTPIKEEYLLTSEFEKTNEAYALAKVAALKTCEFYNKQYGTNFISLMPTNLFGENDNFNLETAHLLPAVIRKFRLAKLYEEKKFDLILKDFLHNPLGFGLDEKINRTDTEEILSKLGIRKGYITLWGTGNVYREFMSSDTLADAILFFLENKDYKDIDGFVNITSGSDIKLSVLYEIVKQITGYNGEIKYDTSMPDGTPRKLMSSEKLNKLGYKTNVDLKSDIKAFYDMYCRKFG